MTVHKYKLIAVMLALNLLGCSASDTSSPDYVGSWKSETPKNTSININATTNGQPQTITVNGKLNINFQASDDGSIARQYFFDYSGDPFCNQVGTGTCSLEPVLANQPNYSHMYMGNRITQEGLLASLVTVTNEDNNTSIEGYIYGSNKDRLCLSYNLLDTLFMGQYANKSDPLALDFNHCFVRI